MVENQKKRKPTFVHEEPRDTKDKSDDGHASHDMLCVPTMQVRFTLDSNPYCWPFFWRLASLFLHLLKQRDKLPLPSFEVRNECTRYFLVPSPPLFGLPGTLELSLPLPANFVAQSSISAKECYLAICSEHCS
ncbi:hypothetical protein D5086_016381 [Populus alba]|uniref:Uncharacterized protein n=1 Tax=Populus alba TaxID=43335 RepID=A0ACC4BU63_POPAL